MAHDNAEIRHSGGWVWLFGWGVSGALCLLAGAQLFLKAGSAGADSWFPMSRALRILHRAAGEQVYQILFYSGHIKFQYPPTSLLLMDLLRWLGITATTSLNAINAWLLVLMGLAFAAFAVRMLGDIPRFGYRLPIGPLAFLATVAFYPNRLALQFGQIQIFLGLLFVLSCLALLHKKSMGAGCIIAGAATVKPQFLFLGALALWRRDWRFVIGFSLLAGAALALSIALYGWQNHLEYIKVLGYLSQHGEYHHLNQSINGILNRILYVGPSVDVDPDNPIPNSGFPPFIPAVYFVSTVTSLILVAIPFGFPRVELDRIQNILAFCTASILFTMASPIAWVHHYNVLLPAYVVGLRAVLDSRPAKRKRLRIALLVISFVLTAFPLVSPFGPTVPSLNLWQSHVFIGALLLAGVLLFELFKRPEHARKGGPFDREPESGSIGAPGTNHFGAEV